MARNSSYCSATNYISTIDLGRLEERLRRCRQTSDIVINGTASIGLYVTADARGLPWTFKRSAPGMVVADVIFSPARTHWLRDAEARSRLVLDGLGMLVNQGHRSAIQYWTGIRLDADKCRRTVEKTLGL